MYAVINDRSRQHTVRKGDVILCDLDAAREAGESITFENVLLIGDEGTTKIGKPFVQGASVTAEVIGVEKGAKTIAFRFKRRKNVRRKRGHRAHFTKVRIQDIRA